MDAHERLERYLDGYYSNSVHCVNKLHSLVLRLAEALSNQKLEELIPEMGKETGE